jgi:hypothetical protein
MHLIGPANWYLPTWLARSLPRLDIEAGKTGEEVFTASPEPTRPAS